VARKKKVEQDDPTRRRLQIPIKCGFLLHPSRYKVLYGGRGAAKSQSIARVLLALGVQRRIRVLCAREFQSSIKDSVHLSLKDRIRDLELGHHYSATQTAIVGENGTEFLFAGLKQNVEAIKSTEGINICWIEEAESISEESWRVLIPTIRAEGSELWINFNPQRESA